MPSLREAQHHHAQHYLEVLRTLNKRYLQGGKNINLTLAKFDQDWSQIEQGQVWAVRFINYRNPFKIFTLF